MPPGYDLILEGDGDIWRITATPQKGQRTFRFDADKRQHRGRKLHQHAAFLPHRAAGRGQRRRSRSAFDDGPDPRNTPQILDILKQKHAPATFFVIGSAANESLGLLKREYDEGNEIGNHTYTHPHIDDISRAQLELELNLTERLFASTLGIKTLLFRPPYGIDHQPETASEVAPLPIPQVDGLPAGGRAHRSARLGRARRRAAGAAKVIVQRVLEQAGRAGNIVLLHDGGGDRSDDGRGAAEHHRRAARGGLPVGAGLRSDRASRARR